ncbi:MAG: hypothetical protein R2762_18900 [Bryobacteraceae bacterium]
MRVDVEGRVKAGQTEVEDLDDAGIGDDDVGGFEIAVDDSGGVRGGEPAGDLGGDGKSVFEAERAGGDLAVQGFAGDEFHGDEMNGLAIDHIGVNIEDRDNVGMAESGSSACFLHEAALALRIGDGGGRKDFERDLAIEASVEGAIDGSHAAFTQFLFNAVMP